MAEKIQQTEVDYQPVCPHCEKEIHEIHWRRLKSTMLYEYLFVCPSCRKVLGVGSSAA